MKLVNAGDCPLLEEAAQGGQAQKQRNIQETRCPAGIFA